MHCLDKLAIRSCFRLRFCLPKGLETILEDKVVILKRFYGLWAAFCLLNFLETILEVKLATLKPFWSFWTPFCLLRCLETFLEDKSAALKYFWGFRTSFCLLESPERPEKSLGCFWEALSAHSSFKMLLSSKKLHKDERNEPPVVFKTHFGFCMAWKQPFYVESRFREDKLSFLKHFGSIWALLCSFLASGAYWRTKFLLGCLILM